MADRSGNAMTGKSDLPLVSVIVPCFNHAASVRGAVESALASTHGAIEVIVLDDGSDDDPREALDDLLTDERVRLLRRPHAGSNMARREAIAQSSGAFVAFLDADDRMTPDRIAAQLALAQAHGPRVLVFCGSRLFHRGRSRMTKAVPRAANAPDMTDAFIRGMFRPNSATLLVARDLYDELGGFDPSYRHLETHLQLRAVAAGARVFAPPSIQYEVHRDGHSLSTQSHGEDMERFIAEVDRLRRSPGASPRLRRYCRTRQRINALYLLGCSPTDRRRVLVALRASATTPPSRAVLAILSAIEPLLGTRRPLALIAWLRRLARLLPH
ncbi:glycosyltransferase family 2 protein [Sphingomonas baiyangensis]|uniref:Glycosyltransferase n=1 Tax=Sphingomonas baiyangensis TaxID=2572576 RepID=A0A4U1L508_9SPHN|nr:glycosyltransferase family A protein [Sphingomonas baiyangensis]TKD51872.1 glycosyltransferase [Sphingomonas baiyangensis]